MSIDAPNVSGGARNVRRKPAPSLAESDVEQTLAPAAPSEPLAPSRLRRWLLGALGTVTVLVVGGSAAWSARHYVRTSSRFSISEVSVAGAQRRTEAELLTEAGVAKGENIFAIDLDKARQGLLADPWIRSASVARKLPSTILMQLVEHEAAALVVCGADTYLATREGTIIKRIEAADPTDLQVVTGIPVATLATDREAATLMIRHALDLASEYEHSALAARSPLQEIHVEPNGELSLVVGKSTLMLHMGAPPYRKKVERAVRVVSELDRRGARPGEIMLDDEVRPDRVVVRMR